MSQLLKEKAILLKNTSTMFISEFINIEFYCAVCMLQNHVEIVLFLTRALIYTELIE
jgi:hypothetical protein